MSFVLRLAIHAMTNRLAQQARSSRPMLRAGFLLVALVLVAGEGELRLMSGGSGSFGATDSTNEISAGRVELCALPPRSRVCPHGSAHRGIRCCTPHAFHNLTPCGSAHLPLTQSTPDFGAHCVATVLEKTYFETPLGQLCFGLILKTPEAQTPLLLRRVSFRQSFPTSNAIGAALTIMAIWHIFVSRHVRTILVSGKPIRFIVVTPTTNLPPLA